MRPRRLRWSCPMAMVSKRSSGDKGYHSNQALVDLEAVGLRSYISETRSRTAPLEEAPRGSRPCLSQTVGAFGLSEAKRLLRQRGERLERPFAHLYETGRMRRVHLRGHGKHPQARAATCLRVESRPADAGRCAASARPGASRAVRPCSLTLYGPSFGSPEVLWPVIATLCLPSTCLGHRLAHRDDRRLHVSVRTVFTTGC